jgi:hypothetical protein
METGMQDLHDQASNAQTLISDQFEAKKRRLDGFSESVNRLNHKPC